VEKVKTAQAGKQARHGRAFGLKTSDCIEEAWFSNSAANKPDRAEQRVTGRRIAMRLYPAAGAGRQGWHQSSLTKASGGESAMVPVV